MFDTPVINVAIGLVFCFAATALAASTITEVLASLIKLRANSLVTGVRQMLNDPNFNGLALQVYNHALVHLRATARWTAAAAPGATTACPTSRPKISRPR